MKRLLILFVVIAFGISGMAQSSEKMSYQAVIRDANGNLVVSKPVGMKISILRGSASGTPVYVETHEITSNENGLVSIEIGAGTPVSGTFSGIDWSGGMYFIKTETDPSGGTSYSLTATSQILSVPFSIYATKAATAADGVKLTGDQSIAGTKTFTGNINAGSHNIVNVAEPVNARDVATKAYADKLKPQITILKNTVNAGGYVTDIDGNTYNTVLIGKRIWMTENLKVTKYNNGTPVGFVNTLVPPSAFSKFTESYCWYNFDPASKDIYGALYSSKVAGIYPDKNICPVGWHPSNGSDWLDLLKTLDPNASSDYGHPSQIAGAGLKATGTIEGGDGYWHDPNTGATNVSGFTGLPGGKFDGKFEGMGYFGYWWINYEMRVLSNNSTYVGGSETDSYGLSIRCVKD
jgi:uncharacterized protein (TIGR02145 family)